MDRGVQVAVQLEDMQLFVVFKLVRSVFRDFNDGSKNLRGSLTNRQLKIVDHVFLASPSGLGREIRRLIAVSKTV
jgi:hypothetical protein